MYAKCIFNSDRFMNSVWRLYFRHTLFYLLSFTLSHQVRTMCIYCTQTRLPMHRVRSMLQSFVSIRSLCIILQTICIRWECDLSAMERLCVCVCICVCLYLFFKITDRHVARTSINNNSYAGRVWFFCCPIAYSRFLLCARPTVQWSNVFVRLLEFI